jgi:hypothetical protein
MAYNRAEHPKLVGDISTAMIIARLVANHTPVLIPFGENRPVEPSSQLGWKAVQQPRLPGTG